MLWKIVASVNNIADDIWACDFLQLYDALFRAVAFFIVKHGTREVVHVGAAGAARGWRASGSPQISVLGRRSTRAVVMSSACRCSEACTMTTGGLHEGRTSRVASTTEGVSVRSRGSTGVRAQCTRLHRQ
ncbi:MAG: hypothetical protein ACI9OJ_001912 [Myxococcota bacterium]|jgi:hypothetical protein